MHSCRVWLPFLVVTGDSCIIHPSVVVDKVLFAFVVKEIHSKHRLTFHLCQYELLSHWHRLCGFSSCMDLHFNCHLPMTGYHCTIRKSPWSSLHHYCLLSLLVKFIKQLYWHHWVGTARIHYHQPLLSSHVHLHKVAWCQSCWFESHLAHSSGFVSIFSSLPLCFPVMWKDRWCYWLHSTCTIPRDWSRFWLVLYSRNGLQ